MKSSGIVIGIWFFAWVAVVGAGEMFSVGDTVRLVRDTPLYFKDNTVMLDRAGPPRVSPALDKALLNLRRVQGVKGGLRLTFEGRELQTHGSRGLLHVFLGAPKGQDGSRRPSLHDGPDGKGISRQIRRRSSQPLRLCILMLEVYCRYLSPAPP